MPKTIGYHVVVSGFGLWLPGDDRGHWSEAWDERIGYLEPHTLHEGDPVRVRMAQERMKHPPMRLTPPMIQIVAETIDRCADQSDWSITAASIEATHTHMLITYTPRDIYTTIKWIKDQATKSIHRAADPHKVATVGRGLLPSECAQCPIWCKGKWCSFIFEMERWQRTIRYIEHHNIRSGNSPRPYPWITPHKAANAARKPRPLVAASPPQTIPRASDRRSWHASKERKLQPALDSRLPRAQNT